MRTEVGGGRGEGCRSGIPLIIIQDKCERWDKLGRPTKYIEK